MVGGYGVPKHTQAAQTETLTLSPKPPTPTRQYVDTILLITHNRHLLQYLPIHRTARASQA